MGKSHTSFHFFVTTVVGYCTCIGCVMCVCEVLVPSAHFLLPFEACVLVANSYDGWELIIEGLLGDLPSQLTFGGVKKGTPTSQLIQRDATVAKSALLMASCNEDVPAS